jgi:phosphatidylserine decarboxylase
MAHGSAFRFVFSPPHPAARPFLVIAGVVVLAGLVFAGWLAWIGVLFLLFCLYFFRDPERFPPPRPGALLAPADGHVVSVSLAVPPQELGLGALPRWRIATFLSVLDVHVNRMPADGTVTRIAYRHGKFLSANLDKSADVIARRIVCNVREGDHVQAGGRFGIIRFGSRTDLYLPEGVLPLVSEGQKMVGGESVLAELFAEPPSVVSPFGTAPSVPGGAFF